MEDLKSISKLVLLTEHCIYLTFLTPTAILYGLHSMILYSNIFPCMQNACLPLYPAFLFSGMVQTLWFRGFQKYFELVHNKPTPLCHFCLIWSTAITLWASCTNLTVSMVVWRQRKCVEQLKMVFTVATKLGFLWMASGRVSSGICREQSPPVKWWILIARFIIPLEKGIQVYVKRQLWVLLDSSNWWNGRRLLIHTAAGFFSIGLTERCSNSLGTALRSKFPPLMRVLSLFLSGLKKHYYCNRAKWAAVACSHNFSFSRLLWVFPVLLPSKQFSENYVEF